MKSNPSKVTDEDLISLFAAHRTVFYCFILLGAAGVAIACWAQSLVSALAAGWFLRSAFSMQRPSEYPSTGPMKVIVAELNGDL